MVEIYKKTEVVHFGEMIQQFKIVSPVKVLTLFIKNNDKLTQLMTLARLL